MSVIRIDSNLIPEHNSALTDYLRGAGRLTREQWHRLREAIDLLAQSTVTVQGRNYTFAQFYEAFVDRQFALVLILYDDWKARVRLCQTPKGGSTNG